MGEYRKLPHKILGPSKSEFYSIVSMILIVVSTCDRCVRGVKTLADVKIYRGTVKVIFDVTDGF